MKAIEFHERSLLSRSFVGLFKVRNMHESLSFSSQLVRQRVK